MTHSRPSGLESGDLALTVLLQGVASGRRVLWVGDPATGGAERIASFAHDVRVLDTTGRARRSRAGSARVSPLPSRGLELDGAAFDVAIVPDVAVFDDLDARLAEIAAAVGDGVVLAGFSATTERYEACAPSFERAFREVRLLGQARFQGSAFADLDAPDDGESLVVDGTLLRAQAEPLDRYLIVAADELPNIERLLVVQTPVGEPNAASDGSADQRNREVGALRQELERAEARLAQAQARLVSTESELAESRAALKSDDAGGTGGDDGEVRSLETALHAAGRRVRDAQIELARRDTLVRDLVEELREHALGRRGGGGTSDLLEANAILAAAEFENDELRAALAAKSAATPSVGGAPEGSDTELSARVGELSGALVHAESEARDAQQSRDRARAETLKLNAQIGALETRMEGMQLGYETRIALSAPAVDPTELATTAKELARARGECEGLRLRLRDLSASAQGGGAKRDEAALDRADALQAEVQSLREENGRLTLDLAETTQGRDDSAAALRDVSAAMASRDALVTRLQMDLAEEEQVRRANDHQFERANEEIKSLRAGIIEASDAVDERDRARDEADRLRGELQAATAELESLRDASQARDDDDESTRVAAEGHEAARAEAETQLETAKAESRARLAALTAEFDAERAKMVAQLAELQERSREERVASVSALKDLRSVLDAFRVAQDAGSPRASITAAGLQSPSDEAPEARLSRELADKDTLLRSLTAQLEERDDRIRALAKKAAGQGPAGGTDEAAVMELEERVERLQEALENERDARRSSDTSSTDITAEIDTTRELEVRVQESQAALAAAKERVSSVEKDVESLRLVCASTRQELEALVGDGGAEGATAERIGALLSVLGRF